MIIERVNGHFRREETLINPLMTRCSATQDFLNNSLAYVFSVSLVGPHIGKTDKDSIFFISDVVPITMKYIEREYIVGPKGHNKQYIIKNKKLIRELERKVGRIIAYEKSYIKSQGKPKFRQRVLDIHDYLEKELTTESNKSVLEEQIVYAGTSSDT